MKLPQIVKAQKLVDTVGGIAICSSRVPREVSAALFRRSGIGSVGFSVLFMRNFLSFCDFYRSLHSKSTCSEWNA